MSDMSINAARAYLQAAQTAQRTGAGNAAGQNDAGVQVGGQSGFGDMVVKAATTASDASASAENAVASAAMGRGDLVDVVTAVAAAEATLETVVAVRDEVIKAYQDILRMPI